MAQDNKTATEVKPPVGQLPLPNFALKRLEKLVGVWDIKGRTFDSQEDNITGRVVIEWMPGGFFLEQRGEMEIQGFKAQSLEILSYDSSADNFPSQVYSSMSGTPVVYYWNVDGNRVTHWTKGSRYTGTFSEDGNILSGGWRPDKGIEQNAGNTYDAVMTRVK